MGRMGVKDGRRKMIFASSFSVELEEKSFNLSQDLGSGRESAEVLGWTLFNSLVKFKKTLKLYIQEKILDLDLGTDILPNPSMIMDLNYCYHLMFLTLENVFVRIVFDSDLKDIKLFTYKVQFANVIAVHVMDLDSIVLSSSLGKLLLLTCPSGANQGYVEEEINNFKILHYLMPSKEGQVGSMASICWKENLILMGLELGGRLRFWNLNRNVVLKNVCFYN